jgi:hypothetical protein
MGKRTVKPQVENLLSKAILEAKRQAAQEAFDKLATELTQKESEFNAYRVGVSQELNRLQGEYRLLTSMIDA